MKLTAIILLICCLHVSAKTASQTITLTGRNIPLSKVFAEIKKQTGYVIISSYQLLKKSKPVTISVVNQPIEEFIRSVLADQPLSYTIRDMTISIRAKQAVANNNVTSPAEVLVKSLVREIKGIVKDANGNPLAGVSVIVKGTNRGTSTQSDGSFTLDATADDMLEFSIVGYKKSTLSVGTNTTFDVRLELEIVENTEVVVIGYGTRTKGAVTGAISSATEEVFENRPISNAVDALQGVLPGVSITKGSGRPGQNSTLNIRGNSSINGNVPLILIDGIPGNLNLINTNDIANITVLKDAAAAVYGARAGDGVILVTTKKGVKGVPRVTYTVNAGLRDPILPKMTNTLQYAEMLDEALANTGAPRINPNVFERIKANAPPDLTPGVGWNVFFENYPAFYGTHNWSEIMYKPALQQMHNLSISGGGENSDYLLSAGYNRADGNFEYGSHYFERYNVRLNYNIRLSNRLRLETKTSFSNTIDVFPSNFHNIVNDIIYVVSYMPLYNPLGQFYQYEDYRNTAEYAEKGGNTTNKYQFFEGNAKAEFDITRGLKIVSQIGYHIDPYSSQVINKSFEAHDWLGNVSSRRNNPNNATYVNSTGSYKLFNNYLNYTGRFGANHNIDIMVGNAYESNKTEMQSTTGNNFASNNQVFTLNLMDRSNLAYLSRITGTASHWALNSYFGRVGYSFGNKFFTDISLRADGSSKFAPDKKWSALFPAVAMAYNFAEEPFLKSGKMFDLLKLRVSWGETGNQDISSVGLYDYLSMINMIPSLPLGSPNTILPAATSTISSATRTWEKITNKNIGIDVAALNSRLTFSFDYYNKINSGMLVRFNTPQTFGGTPPTQNLGKLMNKGFEASLGWRDQIRDFKYSVRFQLSDSRNTLVELMNTDAYREGLNATREGYPINSYFGYVSDGIIRTEEQLNAYKQLGGDIPAEIYLGDLMYKDLDGDGKITAFGDRTKQNNGDMTFLGDQSPRYLYSSNIDLSYKGFDFQLFLQGVGKRSIFVSDPFAFPLYYVWWQPLAFTYGNTWTPQRPNAPEPRLLPGSYLLDNVRDWNTKASTHRIQSAAYMRVKVITLGYNFSSSILPFLTNNRHLRIYLSGQDIFTFKTKALGGNYDPENADPSENGASVITNYPFNKIYTMGLELRF